MGSYRDEARVKRMVARKEKIEAELRKINLDLLTLRRKIVKEEDEQAMRDARKRRKL